MQARVAIKRRIRKQLAFELERGLLGREQDQWRAFGIFAQRSADFREAAEGLAAAGGAEEKARLHGRFLAQRRKEAKTQRNLFGSGTLVGNHAWLELQ